MALRAAPPLRCLLLPLLLSLVVLDASCGHARAAPLLLAPAELRAGRAATLLLDTSTAADASSYTIELLAGDSGLQLLASASVAGLTPGGAPYLIPLAVPADAPAGPALLRAAAAGGSAAWAQNASVLIRPASEALQVMLQTDKALYRPGQSVRVRALCLDPARLVPVAACAVSIDLQAPGGVIVGRRSGPADATGVLSASFQLASEPLLGAGWQVVARAASDAAAATAAFTVDNYQLPRFGVSVSVDQAALTAADARVSGRVSANYTHGQPVSGSISVHLYQQLTGPSAGQQPQPVAGGEGGIMAADAGFAKRAAAGGAAAGGATFRLLASQVGLPAPGGVAEFSIPLQANAKPTASAGVAPRGTASTAASSSSASGGGGSGSSGSPAAAPIPNLFPYGRYGPGLPVIVVAVFTESASFTSLNGTSRPVPVLASAAAVSLTASPAFKPGLPFAVALKSADGAGAPQAGASYTLRLSVSPQRLCTYAPATEATRRPVEYDATIVTDASGSAIASMDIPRDASCCNVSSLLPGAGDGGAYNPGCSDTSCCAASAYVSLINAPEGVWGAYLESRPRAYSASGTYLSAALAGAAGAPLAAGASASVSVRGTAPWAAGALRWAVLSAGDLVASGAGGAASAPEAGAGASPRHAASLSVPISAAMAPGASLLIWLTTAAGELVADTLAFLVDAPLPNPASAAFADAGPVRPGANVSVLLSAAPGSRIYLLAIDQAAALLGAGAAISSAGLFSRRGALAPAPPKPLGWGCVYFTRRAIASAGAAWATSADVGLDCTGKGQPMLMVAAAEGGFAKRAAGEPVAADNAAAGASAAGATDAASSGGGPLTAVGQVRTFFPETWIFDEVDVGDGGAASLALQAPESMTSYSLSAFAAGPAGVGVAAASAPLTVLMPFFVSGTLPAVATRGERFTVAATVMNYGASAVSATLTLANMTAGVELVDAATVTIDVPAGGAAGASFVVRAAGLGPQRLRLSAQTPAAAGLADATELSILTVAEGLPIITTQNALIQLGSVAPSQTVIFATAPPASAAVVAGSVRARLSVVGDVMGPTISGLDRLITLPYGCGEQTLLTLAPGVAVASYLAGAGALTAAQRGRTADAVSSGYQRELTYRHPDGSFSAFGPGQDAAGSLWLTAFALKVLSQGRAWAYVDPGPLASAAAYLGSHQSADGSFPPLGKVIHSELLGGVGRGAGRALTAFSLVALLEAGPELAPAQAVASAVHYLTSSAASARDGPGAYASALSAYALALAYAALPTGIAGRPSAAQVSAALADLRGRADPSDLHVSTAADSSSPNAAAAGGAGPDGAMRPMVVCEGCGGDSQPPADIEATAYGVLAFLKFAESSDDSSAAQGARADAALAAHWLLAQRGALGGFRSTQDTVIGLQALTAFAATVRGQVGSLSISALSPDGAGASFVVDRSTFDVVASYLLPEASLSGPLTVTATGAGLALLSLELSYHVPALPSPPAYSLAAAWTAAANGSGVDAVVIVVVGPGPAAAGSARRRRALLLAAGAGDAGMMIVEVGLFSGFNPTQASLDALLASGAGHIKRAEYDAGRRTVSLYLDSASPAGPTELAFGVVQHQVVGDYAPATVSAYDYYSPSRRSALAVAPSSPSSAYGPMATKPAPGAARDGAGGLRLAGPALVATVVLATLGGLAVLGAAAWAYRRRGHADPERGRFRPVAASPEEGGGSGSGSGKRLDDRRYPAAGIAHGIAIELARTSAMANCKCDAA